MLPDLLGYAFLILDDSLYQFDYDLISFYKAVELSIHILLDALDLSDEERAIFEVVAFAFLQDLRQGFAGLFFIIIEMLE